MSLCIAFFGHRHTIRNQEITEKLREAVIRLFYLAERQRKQITFLCGGYGNFDALASKIIDSERTHFKNTSCEKVLVTAYMDSRLKNEELKKCYQSVIYPPLENTKTFL